MPLNLPDPPDEKLLKSPIELVVWQLRFSELPEIEALEIGRSLHDALGGKQGDFPSMKKFQESGLNVQLVGPDSPPAFSPAQNVGWRFVSGDRQTTITLTPGSLALETKDYDRWGEGFAPKIKMALEALESVSAPNDETRLGLRYIDRIKDIKIEKPADWNGWLKPWALGAAFDADLAGGVAISETGTIFEVDEEISAKERIALATDEADGPFAVIDVDVSRAADEAERSFDVASILEVSERLHTVAKQLFLATIEPDLYKHLKGDE